MALKPKLEFGERILFRRGLGKSDYPYPYTFAVSDRAIFVTREQHLRSESWIMERIPLDEVVEVSLKAESRWRVFATAAAIFLFGIVLVVFMLIPLLQNYQVAEFRFAPFLLVFLGAAMPFLASRRRVLRVKSANGDYKWKPKIVVNSRFANIQLKFINRGWSRERILSLQNDFVEACARAGVKTEVDEFAPSKKLGENFV